MQVAFETARETDSQNFGPAHSRHARGIPEIVHPIFSLQKQAGNQAVQHLLHRGLIQAKMAISSPGDLAEREADRVADHIMRAHAGIPANSPCACAEGGEMCEECQKQPLVVARKSSEHKQTDALHPILDPVLRSPGQPLDAETRALFERRFGEDLGRVRVHADLAAGESARAIDAHAYTAGSHVVFAPGKFNPQGRDGQWLLAHELTHVVQNSGDARAGAAVLQRQHQTLGTKVTQPAGVKSSFSKITCTFDGKDFVMFGDGKAILTASGQSGRPNTVAAADATACKGSSSDSYMNNPRYVGIKDNGPIPEGEYTFARAEMVQFTSSEQLQMSLAGPGTYVDPTGADVHGDWGAARAALTPTKIEPSSFCGNTRARSGFYLHGGSMPGSSGCIDIGNTAITEVIKKLEGYTSRVQVKVKYTQPAPSIGVLDRAAGRFMYPAKKDPSIWDRFQSLLGGY